MFIIRDMVGGEFLGEPFASNRFKWHGTNDICMTRIEHGLEYKPEETVLQRVYEIVDLPVTGAGSIVIYGAPTYDIDNDRVTRTVTKEKSGSDIASEKSQWVRDRADAYEASIHEMKGYPQGNKITGLGFVVDAVIAELVARGGPATPEFAELLKRIAAVKQAHPKP